ncbi:MAG: glycoside hydrolase family 13 protein [Bifidobacteriaceae bacterium]|jgi:alpha-glucosidase|nr:glycoside hydrolase family 13 protein [Bifidobacteriaceae bacterium]
MALTNDPNWWRTATVYQVYPRSFADSDGDGLGDLNGITSRIDYLQALGVDAVWLSPFYPSALADGGYDVDDYRAVDPRLGTLEDFDRLVAALHGAGMRVIVDIVPNHAGSGHVWFQEALAAPKGSPARDRFIFMDGLPANSMDNAVRPPSDWANAFGGSVWEPVGDGQFYLHLFAKEQPDFNWSNREVRDEFLKTLRFWSDRGVDAFRVDVAMALAKDLTAQPLPSTAELDAQGSGPHHPFTDRDEVHEIFSEWRELFNSYDPPRAAVGEVWVDDPARRALYARPSELGQAFNFDLLQADWSAEAFRQVVASNLALAAASGSSSTWVFSNHDVVRAASRLALPGAGGGNANNLRDAAWLRSGGTEPVIDRAVGLARARAAALFMLALPGSAYLYQGEELGLPEVLEIPPDQRQDPAFHRTGGQLVGRDGSRVPLPWEPTGPSFGFGAGPAHLPQPSWFADFAASAQAGVAGSTLEFYRSALRLREALRADESLTWCADLDSPDALGFARGNGWRCYINFGTRALQLPAGQVLVSSAPAPGPDLGSLEPDTAVWLDA